MAECSKSIRKLSAIFLSISLLLLQSLAYAESGTVVSNPTPAKSRTGSAWHNQPAFSGSPIQFEKNSKFSIPAKWGTLESGFQGQSGKTILYIQDAHDSLEIQKNIVRLISYWVGKGTVRTVYEEGYEGKLPTDEYFDLIQDAGLRRAVADHLMDRLCLGGADYAHVTRQKDFDLIGADDLGLYFDNVRFYAEFKRLQADSRREIDSLDAEIEKLAYRSFPEDGRSWLKLKERLAKKQIDHLTYAERLVALAHKKFDPSARKMRAQRYPTLDAMIDALHAKDPETIARSKMLAGQYKQFFEELGRLESDYAGAWLESDANRALFEYFRYFDLVRRLCEFQLSSAEYDAFRDTRFSIDTDHLSRFIANQTHKPVLLYKNWETSIQSAIRFYETANQRSRAFGARLDHFLADRDQNCAILVYGGFHRGEIERLLKEKQISYFVVTPKGAALSPKHERYYQERMALGDGHLRFPPGLARATAPPKLYLETSSARLSDYLEKKLPPRVFRRLRSDLALARSETRSVIFPGVGGRVQSTYEQWRRHWMAMLERDRPTWLLLPGFSFPYGGSTQGIKYDPEQIPADQIGAFRALWLPNMREKGGYSIDRDQIRSLVRKPNLLHMLGPGYLLTDPLNEDFIVVSNGWPSSVYDAQLITDTVEPQVLTLDAIRAEIEWAYRGGFLEYHHLHKFVDHLHIHLVPMEHAPISAYADRFVTEKSSGDLRIGHLDYPQRNIALTSKNPVTLLQAVYSLGSLLEREDHFFIQALFRVPDTDELTAVFVLTQRTPLPIGFRVAGTVNSANLEFQEDPEAMLREMNAFWLAESELAEIREGWWRDWQAEQARKTHEDLSPNVSGFDQELTEAELAQLIEDLEKRVQPRAIPKTETEPAPPDLVLTYHGRIAPLKNLTVLIKTAKWLARYFEGSGKRIVLEIMGGDKRNTHYEKYLRLLAESEGIGHLVYFRGPFETSELQDRYAQSPFPMQKRIYLFPGENESFGLGPLEAMRLGIPVVASMSDSVKEIVDDPESDEAGGVLVDVRGLNQDEKAVRYAAAVLQPMGEPDYWEYYRQHARSVSLRFRPEIMAQQYDQLFRSLSGKPSGEPYELHYISPGLFPYEDGGVAQWARNLLSPLLRWSEPQHSGLTGPSAIRMTSLEPARPGMSEGNRAIADSLSLTSIPAAVFSTPKLIPDERTLREVIRPVMKRLMARILNMPAEGPFSDRFRTGQTTLDDIEILHEANLIFRKYDFRDIVERLGYDLFRELVPGWVESVTPEEWEAFRDHAFFGRKYFDFLQLTPVEDGDVMMIDSPHPFGMLGVLSKYYSESGRREIPKAMVFVQHSRGERSHFEKIRKDSRLGPLTCRIAEQFFVYFVRFYREHADRIVSVSHAVDDDGHTVFQVPQERSEVIYNGIDFALKEPNRSETRRVNDAEGGTSLETDVAKTFESARSELRGLSASSRSLDLYGLIQSTKDIPATMFFGYTEVIDEQNPVRMGLVALASVLGRGAQKIIIYGADDLGDDRLAVFRKLGIVVTDASLQDAFSIYGDDANRRNVNVSNQPELLLEGLSKVSAEKLKNVLMQDESEIWAAYLRAITDPSLPVPGMDDSQGYYRVVGEFLRSELRRFQAGLAIALSA
ncbi:MAG: glycosyltransferase [Candidatus Omnitrophica bacterium]|nr:glycosyltransferase [Candidatus Omnitrophota bacterium]